MFQNVNDLKY